MGKIQKMFKSRKTSAILMTAVVFVFGVVMGFLGVKNTQKSYATLAGFDPGNIMSDYIMSDYNSMSIGEIQNWLNAHSPCNNTDWGLYNSQTNTYGYKLRWNWSNGHFVCVSQERFGNGLNFQERAGEDSDSRWIRILQELKNDIGVPNGQTAAEIIYQAAQDYKINPKVLLVLLEKEEGLISDPLPNSMNYGFAMGYGCPDTARCNPKYAGFKKQVRYAAAFYRDVLNGDWGNYHIGVNEVRWSPRAECGSGLVNIQNRATIALYTYTPYQPNAAAMNWGGDYCSAYGNRNFYHYYTEWFGDTRGIDQRIDLANASNDLDFSYQSHVQDVGWQTVRKGGVATGTVGQKKRMESYKLDLGQFNDSVVYRSHVQNIGWENIWKRGGEISGTTGAGLRVEAIQMQLLGELAEQYSIYYRVHVENVGWMAWVKDGQPTGTQGQSLRIEAMQIAIVKKTSDQSEFVAAGTSFIPVETAVTIPEYAAVRYSSHVQNIGWMNFVENGQVSGTSGQSLRVESFKLSLVGKQYEGVDVEYRTHVQNIGWMPWVKNGEMAGTEGQSLRMEAMEIRLTGENADKFDIQYRTHVQYIGWMPWVKNGEMAGTEGQSLRMEAIEIKVVDKQ